MVRAAAGAFASVGARAVELCARELRVEKDDVSEQEERRDEEVGSAGACGERGAPDHYTIRSNARAIRRSHRRRRRANSRAAANLPS